MAIVSVTTIEDFDKEVKQAEGLVVVDFWAPWCMPCKMFAKVYETVSEEVSDVKFVKVNVDEASNLAAEQGIRSLPTIRMFKGGDKVAERMGSMGKDAFVSFLEENK